MAERCDTVKEKVKEKVERDEEDIKVLYMGPENFAEFRNGFSSLMTERSIVTFCAA